MSLRSRISGWHTVRLRRFGALRAVRRAAWYTSELMECRILLSAQLSGFIPTQINPSSASQALFAPGVSTYSLSAVPQQSQGTYYKFSVDNSVAGTLTSFKTSATSSQADAALALFDADGNRVFVIDSDSIPASPANETLATALTSQKVYVLGVYTRGLGPVNNAAVPVTLNVDTRAQEVNSTIAIDLSAGTASFSATGQADAFKSPVDESYFPIELTNVGASATVTVSPYGLDGQFYAQLFQRIKGQTAWTSIARGSGSPVTLTAAAPPGLDDTDAEYLLATSPNGFNSAAQPLKVDLATAQLLGPTSVSPAGALDLGPLFPVAPGASAVQAGTSFLGGSPRLYTVLATATGPMTVTATSSFSGPLLSVYDSTGNTLLAVGSSSATAAATGAVTFNATVGITYVIRFAATNGNNNGVVTLAATQTYTPTAITSTAAVQQIGGLSIGPGTAARFTRSITPVAGADFLALELSPDAGSTFAPQIYVSLGGEYNPLGNSYPHLSASAAAGSPATLGIDLSRFAGPFEVFVCGSSGDGAATLSNASITVPRQLSIAQLATQPQNLTTGAVARNGALRRARASGRGRSITSSAVIAVRASPYREPAGLWRLH